MENLYTDNDAIEVLREGAAPIDGSHRTYS